MISHRLYYHIPRYRTVFYFYPPYHAYTPLSLYKSFLVEFTFDRPTVVFDLVRKIRRPRPPGRVEVSSRNIVDTKSGVFFFYFLCHDLAVIARFCDFVSTRNVLYVQRDFHDIFLFFFWRERGEATVAKINVPSLKGAGRGHTEIFLPKMKITPLFACSQQEMMMRSGQTTNDLDPFLSCSSSTVDHTRQESADSGLGLGNNYSLPHTPEDFLSSNMDDNMDCTSGKYYSNEKSKKNRTFSARVLKNPYRDISRRLRAV